MVSSHIQLAFLHGQHGVRLVMNLIDLEWQWHVLSMSLHIVDAYHILFTLWVLIRSEEVFQILNKRSLRSSIYRRHLEQILHGDFRCTIFVQVGMKCKATSRVQMLCFLCHKWVLFKVSSGRSTPETWWTYILIILLLAFDEFLE